MQLLLCATDPDDAVLFCEKCGFSYVPDDDWLCDRCNASDGSGSSCGSASDESGSSCGSDSDESDSDCGDPTDFMKFSRHFPDC